MTETWPPCPAPFNLAAHVLAAGGDAPDRMALQILRTGGAERWSYARLIAAVRGAGSGFLAAGLAPGDRVLIRLPSTPAFPVAFLGAIAAGIVPVPVAMGLTEPELARAAALVAPRLIVTDEGGAQPALPRLTAAQVLGMETRAPVAWDMGDPERLAYVVFTSGTSGSPLAVGHAHRAIWARGMMRQGWQGLGTGDRLLHAGALNWTYTLGVGLMDPWAAGATALIPAPGVDPTQLPLLARRFDATILAAAPGHYRRLLRQGLPPLPRLRHGLSAGEALSPALRQAWRDATGTDLHEALGMTEVSTFLSGSPDRPAPMGATGYPQPGRRLALLDDEGRPVTPGEEGQIAVHGSDPGLMLGYLGAPQATAERMKGEWFLTGDMAREGADGSWTGLGRRDDQINAGGLRVSPAEVEAAHGDFPGLAECAAVEVPVPGGATVIALFYTATGPLDEAALAVHGAARLAPWKRPRLYRPLPALPRGANAKLDRRALSRLPLPQGPA